MVMGSFLLAVFFSGQDVQSTNQTMEEMERPIVQYITQVDHSDMFPEPQDPQSSTTIKGSQQTTAEIPYGEFFNKESEELPFYLRPEFGGLDGSDHRREVRPNSAGQRLDMDQYNRQVRPPVGP